MNLLSLAKEVALLAGYTITGTDAQSVADKAKALRRINGIRADIVSRFSGRWASLYREGWLPLVAVYSTGTVAVTVDSRTVTGSSTVWTSAMVGRKFLGPDNMYYKIAAVASNTSLTLTEPYQSATVASGGAYQIWKDEYTLYPDVFSLIDFVNYIEPNQMREYTNKQSRSLQPRPTANETPRYYQIIGRKNLANYSTGTISGTINTRTITGSGTSWIDNLLPGSKILVTVSNTEYCYHVDTVDSDTQVTVREYVAATISAGTSYTGRSHNALVVKFLNPSSQTMVNYAYYSKVYPLVSDNDEDWLLELYPHLVINGVLQWDYLDKNDPVRASQAAQLFENQLHNAHVSDSGQFGGTVTIGLDIPDTARE